MRHHDDMKPERAYQIQQMKSKYIKLINVNIYNALYGVLLTRMIEARC